MTLDAAFLSLFLVEPVELSAGGVRLALGQLRIRQHWSERRADHDAHPSAKVPAPRVRDVAKWTARVDRIHWLGFTALVDYEYGSP